MVDKRTVLGVLPLAAAALAERQRTRRWSRSEIQRVVAAARERVPLVPWPDGRVDIEPRLREGARMLGLDEEEVLAEAAQMPGVVRC